MIFSTNVSQLGLGNQSLAQTGFYTLLLQKPNDRQNESKDKIYVFFFIYFNNKNNNEQY